MRSHLTAFLTAAAVVALGQPSAAQEIERVLEKEIVIEASLDRVWNGWTSEEGIRAISPSSNIDLRPGGPYELFLHLPPDEQGRRGAEGSTILTVLPQRFLAFDWTFPPTVPVLRREGAKTHVAVFFAPVEGGVRVRLLQYGWQEGPDWEAGYGYFDEAWSGVLQTLKAHLERAEARETSNPISRSPSALCRDRVKRRVVRAASSRRGRWRQARG